MRSRILATALALCAAATPAHARKGDIIPQAGKGVAVFARDGRKWSRTQLGNLRIEIGVSTGNEMLLVNYQVTNTGSGSFDFKPNQFTVSAADGDVDPLDPEQYIELAYQVKPYAVKNGKIIEEKGKTPVKAFTPGGQVPGTSSGASLAEQMANDQWEEGSRDQRMAVTKEWIAMKHDAMRYGGTLDASQSATGKLPFQRNQLALPFDVHFVSAGKKLTVRFTREK